MFPGRGEGRSMLRREGRRGREDIPRYRNPFYCFIQIQTDEVRVLKPRIHNIKVYKQNIRSYIIYLYIHTCGTPKNPKNVTSAEKDLSYDFEKSKST